MKNRNGGNLKDVWQTPDELLDMLRPDSCSIDLDPCAAPDTNIGDTNYTAADDGLSKQWHGRVFVNPPFSEKGKWLDKVISEQDATDVIFVATPDSTDVESWWHGKIAEHADYVWFSKNRIYYIDPETGRSDKRPTFGTAVSIFGEPCDAVLEELDENGHVVKTVSVS